MIELGVIADGFCSIHEGLRAHLCEQTSLSSNFVNVMVFIMLGPFPGTIFMISSILAKKGEKYKRKSKILDMIGAFTIMAMFVFAFFIFIDDCLAHKVMG